MRYSLPYKYDPSLFSIEMLARFTGQTFAKSLKQQQGLLARGQSCSYSTAKVAAEVCLQFRMEV
jgi:hypothetical protein